MVQRVRPPSHLPFLITNHLPKVPADDPALWARLLVIPVVAGAGTPTLPKVVDALFNPSLAAAGATVGELIVDGREVGHALRRLVSGDLAGLFDGESTVTFDPSLPMISLDLSRISGSDQLIAMVMAVHRHGWRPRSATPRGDRVG